MRLAFHHVNSEAARKADKQFAVSARSLAKGKPGPLSIRMTCDAAPLRKLWLEHYVKAGGEVVEVCGERVAPLVAEPTIAQIADRVFYSRHHELGGRELTLDDADKQLRVEWMDLYEEYGGRVAKVCHPAGC
jgi:hypothetical protein